METRSILKVELPASTNNCYRAVEHGLSGVIDSHRPCPFAGSRKLQPSSTTRFSCPAAKGGAACGGHSPDNAVVPRIHLASFWPCHSTAYSVAPPHSFQNNRFGGLRVRIMHLFCFQNGILAGAHSQLCARDGDRLLLLFGVLIPLGALPVQQVLDRCTQLLPRGAVLSSLGTI